MRICAKISLSCPEFRRDLRHVWFYFIFLKTVQTVTFHEEGQVQRAVHGIHISRVHVELFFSDTS